MQLFISNEKGVRIPKELFGLFFEDINYAADGGLYAEMIENRSFVFLDCYGERGIITLCRITGTPGRPSPEKDRGKWNT